MFIALVRVSNSLHGVSPMRLTLPRSRWYPSYDEPNSSLKNADVEESQDAAAAAEVGVGERLAAQLGSAALFIGGFAAAGIVTLNAVTGPEEAPRGRAGTDSSCRIAPRD